MDLERTEISMPDRDCGRRPMCTSEAGLTLGTKVDHYGKFNTELDNPSQAPTINRTVTPAWTERSWPNRDCGKVTLLVIQRLVFVHKSG